MPRATARRTSQEFADEWDHRGVRAWHEGWWEIGRETGNLLAPILGVPPNTISMHQNVTVAQCDHRVLLRLTTDRAARSSCRTSTFRRTTTCSRASAATAPRSSIVPSDDPIRPRPRSLPRRDRRADAAGADVARAVPERLHAGRARGDREGAPGRRARRSSTSIRRPAPCRWISTGSDVDFAVGGSVKWLCGGPGAGYLYVRPDLAADAAGRRSSAGRRTTSPFEFETGAGALRRHRRSASRAARRTCRRSIRRAPATRSSPRSACRRFASARCS